MQGTRLGPYRIDRELGSGGMGKVYAATGPDGVVALKVVHPHLLETPGFFKRFLREAQVGQTIRHDNVVRTLDCDQEFADGRPQCFLVMEYVEGQTLTDLLRELERVPEELCRHVAREICKGLAAVHEAGVVHRDLKPENVLITPEHVVKIMDLGVAQVADEALRLSKSGAFVGSVEYAAPEQFKSGDVDGRTDLHALGVALYELSSGQHPYRGGGFHEVLTRVCDATPRRLGDVNPQLSAFFEEVVHTLLVKDPRGRFTSATQLLSVLEQGEDSEWWRGRARALQADTRRPIRRIRIPRETAVYGRERELSKLSELYAKAKSGDGQVVLIDGEAGIGKSRLVDELIARLQSAGEDLNFLFGSYPPGGAATAAGGFSSAYREQFGEAGCGEYLVQTPLLVPAFDAVLRGEPPPTGVTPLTKDSLGTCFVHATRALALERPTVVLIDDLHFAPEEARTLFMALAQAVTGHRVLLVGTMRPGVSEDWVANVTRLDHATRVEVPRLGAKDLGDLLADSFHSRDLAHAIGMRIAVKSDGNPFFAFEIIRGLRDGQFITQRDDGTWATTQVIDEIQIPSSVLDLVNARVADLTQDERNVLDVAACWGFEFDPLLVGDALGIPQIPLMRLLAQVEKKHRLVRAAGRRFAFDHHQVQEALYSGLPELLREPYHAALAEALETRTKAAEKDPADVDGASCVDLCEQYLKGARGESALRYLPAALAHLSKGYLTAQVIALGERALAVPGLLTGDERATVLLQLVAALDLPGRRTRQEECVREAERLAEAAGDDALRGRVARALGLLLWRTSRHEEAETAYRRAVALSRAGGDRQTEAAAEGGLGSLCCTQDRRAEAQEHHERHLAMAREIGDRLGEAQATGNLGIVFKELGRFAEAREHHERSIALNREIGNRQGEAAATGNLGNVLSAEGRLAEAQEHLERQLAICREIGSRQGEATATANLAGVFHRQGRNDVAVEYDERLLALCREIGDRHGEIASIGNLGVDLCALGRLKDALEHFERYLALCRETGRRKDEARAAGHLGTVFSALGRLEAAQEHQELHLALSREIGYRGGEAAALYNLGELGAERGEWERSEECLLACAVLCEEIGDWFVGASTQLLLGARRAARSREAGGDGECGRDALVAARDAGVELGLAGIEVLARCELALLPGGDPADALTAYTEHEEWLCPEDRQRARLLLFRATRDRTHIAEAKRLLDDALAMASAEHHDAMCTNIGTNRETLAAWRQEFSDADDSRGTESVTRAGLS